MTDHLPITARTKKILAYEIHFIKQAVKNMQSRPLNDMPVHLCTVIKKIQVLENTIMSLPVQGDD